MHQFPKRHCISQPHTRQKDMPHVALVESGWSEALDIFALCLDVLLCKYIHAESLTDGDSFSYS